MPIVYKSVILRLLHDARRDEETFIRSLDAIQHEAPGAPDHWCAKDHIAHAAYWRQRLADRLQAVLDGRPQPGHDAWETANDKVFEDRRYWPWPDVLAAAARSYEALSACIECLTDEDLVT